ncbi:MAG: hypothetical protein A2020_05580 [Lentisphaerae bacterium GWF2_45_14]|nr:MAG: hypothetical protein A2020_05580 [Lentisphaerae bacterium GWF2_45_14]
MKELSRKNESLLRSLYTRHGRKKHDMCVCEGLRCCRELLLSAPDLLEFAVCSETFDRSALDTDFCVVSEENFNSISATVNSQGVLFVAKRPDTSPENKETPSSPFITVLDRIGDPGNFGTIARTLKAAGLKDLWITSGTVDAFSDKAIRSGMSAQFSINIREFNDLPELAVFLRAHGYDSIFRTDPHEGLNCFTEKKLFDKSAVIFGSESGGAGELEGSMPLRIPMPGDYESINVAQAATVIIFEYVRRLYT